MLSYHCYSLLINFFYNHPAPTEIYTLSLHDALPGGNAGGRDARQRHQPHDRQGADHEPGRIELAPPDTELRDPRVSVMVVVEAFAALPPRAGTPIIRRVSEVLRPAPMPEAVDQG